MTQINIRVDETVKAQTEEICKSLGMNITTAVNVFFNAMIREKGIPFDLKLKDEFSEKENEEIYQVLKARESQEYKLEDLEDFGDVLAAKKLELMERINAQN